MKKIIFLLLAFLILFSACAPKEAELSGEESSSAGGFDGFLDELESSGFEYTIGESDEENTGGFLSVPRRYVLVGEEIISVYEYPTNAEMENDAACIDRGGCSISVPGRVVNISWVSLPHFYKRDRVIVNYVGENERIIDHLETYYGREFAGAGLFN